MFRGRPYRPDEVPGPEAVLRADGHWSTNELRAYHICNETPSRITRDYARDGYGELWGNSWWGGRPGLGAVIVVSNEVIDGICSIWRTPKTAALAFRTTQSFTWGWIGMPTDIRLAFPLICSNATYQRVMWRLRADNTANALIVSSSTVNVMTTHPYYTSGQNYCALAAWDATTSTLTSVFNGEVKTATKALDDVECTSGDYWATRAQDSNWQSVGANPFVGNLAQVMVWGRALTVAEMKELCAQRYLPLWRPARVRIFDMGSKARHRLWYPGFSAPSFGPWT